MKHPGEQSQKNKEEKNKLKKVEEPPLVYLFSLGARQSICSAFFFTGLLDGLLGIFFHQEEVGLLDDTGVVAVKILVQFSATCIASGT